MTRRRLALAALGALLAAHLIVVPFRQGWTQMGTDFPNYYTAAVVTLKHKPLRQFYDWVCFNGRSTTPASSTNWADMCRTRL